MLSIVAENQTKLKAYSEGPIHLLMIRCNSHVVLEKVNVIFGSLGAIDLIQ